MAGRHVLLLRKSAARGVAACALQTVFARRTTVGTNRALPPPARRFVSSSAANNERPPMTKTEIDALWEENVSEFNKMYVPAGTIIKMFLIGLEENGPAYVRLSEAEPDGHKIKFEVVDPGPDDTVIARAATHFKLTITDNTIEVPHA
jgi:hypothetical protein